jgi:hypothetical protein
MNVLFRSDVAQRLNDAVGSGAGGFRDTNELINTAVDSYLVELMFGQPSGGVAPVTVLLDPGTHREDLAIPVLARGSTATDALSDLVDEPLLGLHNRDWPSFWALSVLAAETEDGPIDLRAFLLEATTRAWKVADQLTGFGRRATALLPSNREKKQSAESAFQSFAIASVAKRADTRGRFRVSGPLPLWRTLALVSRSSGGPLVGVTEEGWKLLTLVQGLSPLGVHPQNAAEAFMTFLSTHAPSDHWGFKTLLSVIGTSPDRATLVDAFQRARPWTDAVASSAAQGYLARAREWGLVEPGLRDGRYELTDLGRRLAA